MIHNDRIPIIVYLAALQLLNSRRISGSCEKNSVPLLLKKGNIPVRPPAARAAGMEEYRR